MMYDELIKRLRYLAKVYSICDNENTNEYRLAIEAADAIEELQKRVPKTPHGRLIDADVLLAEFEVDESSCDAHGQEFTFSFIRGDAYCTEWYYPQQRLMDAPTIIEAEKGEE